MGIGVFSARRRTSPRQCAPTICAACTALLCRATAGISALCHAGQPAHPSRPARLIRPLSSSGGCTAHARTGRRLGARGCAGEVRSAALTASGIDGRMHTTQTHAHGHAQAHPHTHAWACGTHAHARARFLTRCASILGLARCGAGLWGRRGRRALRAQPASTTCRRSGRRSCARRRASAFQPPRLPT